jgi:hypothetical protein
MTRTRSPGGHHIPHLSGPNRVTDRRAGVGNRPPGEQVAPARDARLILWVLLPHVGQQEFRDEVSAIEPLALGEEGDSVPGTEEHRGV